MHAETEDPERFFVALRELLLRPVPLDEAHLERVRRKHLGSYVRAFENVLSVAGMHCQEALDDLPPFEAVERMREVTVGQLAARQRELCVAESAAEAIVAP